MNDNKRQIKSPLYLTSSMGMHACPHTHTHTQISRWGISLEITQVLVIQFSWEEESKAANFMHQVEQ